MRRSMVLCLPLQLVFPALPIESKLLRFVKMFSIPRKCADYYGYIMQPSCQIFERIFQVLNE
jgi:hypothetical protein